MKYSKYKTKVFYVKPISDDVKLSDFTGGEMDLEKRGEDLSGENKFETVRLETMLDRHIGKCGNERRDAFESMLRTDLCLPGKVSLKKGSHTLKIAESQR